MKTSSKQCRRGKTQRRRDRKKKKNREGQLNEMTKMLRLRVWQQKKGELKMKQLQLKGVKNWREKEKSEEPKELQKLHQSRLSQLLTKE